MRTKDEWEKALTEYFEAANRKLNLESGKDSQKVFCLEEQKNGSIKTEFLSTKLRNMRTSYKTDEEYDKEIRNLIKNGNIRFYEEGSVEGKTLIFENAENSEQDDDKPEEEFACKSMGLVTERGGFFSKLWSSVKALFSRAAKINQAAERFFDNYQDERKNEIVAEEIERGKREQASVNVSAAQKVINDMKAQMSVQKTFTKNLQDVFGAKLSAKGLSKIGYNINEKEIPKIEINELSKKYKYINPENMPYLVLCSAISTDTYLSVLLPNLIQTSIIEKALVGEYNAEADADLSNLIKGGKEEVVECLSYYLQNGYEGAIASKLKDGIVALNRMIGTSLPNKFMELNSNCLLTTMCIKETMRIINSDPKLKEAVNLSKEDELAAKGAIVIWDITEKSLKAQNEICNNPSCNLEEQLPYIEQDIKMRAELFNSAYLSESNSSYMYFAAQSKVPESMLKETALIIHGTYASPHKLPNLAIAEAGTNPDCFNLNGEKTGLKEKLANKSPNEIMSELNTIFKEEVEKQSRSKLSDSKKPHQATQNVVNVQQQKEQEKQEKTNNNEL